MSNWYELKETLVKDLMDLAKDRPHPMIWIAGVAMSMLASLCYYDSANLVRVRHKLKQLKQQQLDSKSNKRNQQ